MNTTERWVRRQDMRATYRRLGLRRIPPPLPLSPHWPSLPTGAIHKQHYHTHLFRDCILKIGSRLLKIASLPPCSTAAALRRYCATAITLALHPILFLGDISTTLATPDLQLGAFQAFAPVNFQFIGLLSVLGFPCVKSRLRPTADSLLLTSGCIDPLDNTWMRPTVHSSCLQAIDTSAEEQSDEVNEYFRQGNELRKHEKRYNFDPSTASHTDAYVVTHLQQGSHSTYISSPNVDFVPELPTHRLTEEFCYYTDGMLGPFELLKWPQGYDAQEPHHMAAPINPFFFAYSDALTDCPQYESRDAGNMHRQSLPRRAVPELDVWEDPNAPWFNFPDSAWATDPFTRNNLGQLSFSVISRLQAAAQDTCDVILPVVNVVLPHEADRPARHFVSGRCFALERAIHPLQSVQPLVEAILWFREVQRILLELRAWYNYMVVIKPRIDAYMAGKGPSRPYPVLPLRGVFTSRQVTAQTLLHVGVPVWCLRRLYTFSKRTQIGFCLDPVKWIGAFSNTIKRTLGATKVVAPTWSQSAMLDMTALGFTERLRHYSSFSRPIVRKPAPILPDLPPVTEYDTHVPVPEDSTMEPPIASTSGNTSLRHPPQDHKAAPHSDARKTGPVPANAVFAQDGDADVPILLNTSGWRIALEGHYYAFQTPDGADIRSAEVDIALLPKPPHPPTVTGKRRAGKTSNATVVTSSKRSVAWKARRLSERIDIAVHFNVKYGVPPYEPHLQPWPTWRNQAVERVRVETDKVLWAEVVWELSIMHFRMDLIWFDQAAMDDVHKAEAHGDSGRELDLRLDRVNAWMQVWSLQGGLHVGTDPAALDWLVSTDWTRRRTGVARFASLAHSWPGMKLDPFHTGHSNSQDSFLKYERDMYENPYGPRLVLDKIAELQSQLEAIRTEHAALVRDHTHTVQELDRARAPSRPRSPIGDTSSMGSQRRRSPRPDAKKRKRSSPRPSNDATRRGADAQRHTPSSSAADSPSWTSVNRYDIHGPLWDRWVPITHEDVALVFARAVSDPHASARVRTLALLASDRAIADRSSVMRFLVQQWGARRNDLVEPAVGSPPTDTALGHPSSRSSGGGHGSSTQTSTAHSAPTVRHDTDPWTTVTRGKAHGSKAAASPIAASSAPSSTPRAPANRPPTSTTETTTQQLRRAKPPAYGTPVEEWLEFIHKNPQNCPPGVPMHPDHGPLRGRPVRCALERHLEIRLNGPQGRDQHQRSSRGHWVSRSTQLFSIRGLFGRILHRRGIAVQGATAVVRPYLGDTRNISLEDVARHFASNGYQPRSQAITEFEEYAIRRRNTIEHRPPSATTEWGSYPTLAAMHVEYPPVHGPALSAGPPRNLYSNMSLDL
ncbi:hypothetical protein FA95DRAFT_1578471, partial [Auriscalpium vulgare]